MKIIEAEVCPDHVHMFVSIPPKLSVSKFMGILKGKSSLIIFPETVEFEIQIRTAKFWCRGYYVDTVGKNAKRIAEYVKNQLQEDMMYDQISIKNTKTRLTGHKKRMRRDSYEPLGSACNNIAFRRYSKKPPA